MRGQALTDVGEQPLVGQLEDAIIRATFGLWPPKSPPWALWGRLQDVAFGGDGDTGSSPAIAVCGDILDQVDVLLVALEIGDVMALFCLLLIRREAILHVKGDVGRHDDN